MHRPILKTIGKERFRIALCALLLLSSLLVIYCIILPLKSNLSSELNKQNLLKERIDFIDRLGTKGIADLEAKSSKLKQRARFRMGSYAQEFDKSIYDLLVAIADDAALPRVKIIPETSGDTTRMFIDITGEYTAVASFTQAIGRFPTLFVIENATFTRIERASVNAVFAVRSITGSNR